MILTVGVCVIFFALSRTSLYILAHVFTLLKPTLLICECEVETLLDDT